MKILVTGGAGYIGSIAVKKLIEQNYHVVVIDNLSKGKKELVDKKADFYQTDLTNINELEQVFKKHTFNAVLHFGAYKAVEESMENAVKYSDNITGTINLVNCMVKYNIKRLIFSSSAAVYGIPKTDIIQEDAETEPINFYGFTKLNMEMIMKWYHIVHGIEYIALRYFNVAGDGGLNYVDPDAKNIFPIIMEVLTKKREKLTVFGNDYPTRDGTCIRDYIDINDLIDAHILAIKSNYSGPLNLSTGTGSSVLEIIEAVKKVSGKEVIYEIGPRRKGDPASLVSTNSKAKEVLGWQPKRNVDEMVKSTLEAYGIK
ncbi:MAG: UDP-glucose 4-epimerase GalE [Candidatus Woesearchaeota archaeon]